MIRSHAKLLGISACLIWAALPLGAQQPPKVELLTAHRIGETPPMSEYLATHHEKPNAPFRVFPLRKPSHPGHGGGNSGGNGGSGWTDPVLQSTEGNTQISGPNTQQFPGIGEGLYYPPDTNIAVGPKYVVETVNVNWQVYDKTSSVGQFTKGPAPIHSIFAAAVPPNGNGYVSSSDPCTSIDGGDPIVLYDSIDQRWIIAQLAYNISFSNNEYCLAISTSSDPTGSYYAYDLPFNSNLPDYPKLAIWANGSSGSPSSWTGVSSSTNPYAGVYFSANIFSKGSTFTGAVMCGFPLSDVATPPSSLNWVCYDNGTSVYSILPADLQGSPNLSNSTTWPAPPNTPEYYLQFSGNNMLNLYSFAPDFSNPLASATVSNVANITVQPFHEACGGSDCVPQSGTTEPLDSLGDRLMYSLSYRNNGTNQYMVVTQSVQNSSASTQTGVRWYQLIDPTALSSGSGWVVAQQSTFGPNDGTYRWMGSIAQDQFGDLGIGYSESSPSIFPTIGYTGQTPSDLATLGPNTLEAEQQLSNLGAGSQTYTYRWGDYSSMSIDPSNDCTFWYANEYLKSTGSWGTYILSFNFPECSDSAAVNPDFSIMATPSSQTVTVGSGTSTSADYTVYVSSIGGFSSSVTLGVTGLPSVATYNFTPISGVNGSEDSILSITLPSTTPAGTYNLVITGNYGTTPSHSVDVTLVVNSSSSGSSSILSLGAGSFSSSLTAKNSVTSNISVSAPSVSTVTTLSVSGLPPGTSASFSPSSVTGSGSSVLTVTAGGHPKTGNYTLTVTGTTSTGLSATIKVPLTVQ